ncbi:MAG: hypothetical protein JNM56_30555 [Planctomycetia bacterium]|nr:hypothetical protein [Planctomycetia bacterium]
MATAPAAPPPRPSAPPRSSAAANPFAGDAGYDGPAPPWQQAGTQPKHGPEWPWLVGAAPPPDGTQQYDWQKVQPMSADMVRLAPGWHKVRLGMSLLPAASMLVFVTLVLMRLLVLMIQPEPYLLKILLLIGIPITILGLLGCLLGCGLCCLVPQVGKLRNLALCAAGAIFLAILAAMLAVFLSFALEDPGIQRERASMMGFMTVVRGMAYFTSLILLVAGGLLYLFFMRGVARIFENRRLAQHLLYYLLFFAASPVIGLFLYMLFGGTAYVLGLTADENSRSALNVIYTVAQFVLFAVVLAGFLMMVRDVRSSIERAIAPNKA